MFLMYAAIAATIPKRKRRKEIGPALGTLPMILNNEEGCPMSSNLLREA